MPEHKPVMPSLEEVESVFSANPDLPSHVAEVLELAKRRAQAMALIESLKVQKGPRRPHLDAAMSLKDMGFQMKPHHLADLAEREPHGLEHYLSSSLSTHPGFNRSLHPFEKIYGMLPHPSGELSQCTIEGVLYGRPVYQLPEEWLHQLRDADPKYLGSVFTHTLKQMPKSMIWAWARHAGPEIDRISRDIVDASAPGGKMLDAMRMLDHLHVTHSSTHKAVAQFQELVDKCKGQMNTEEWRDRLAQLEAEGGERWEKANAATDEWEAELQLRKDGFFAALDALKPELTVTYPFSA